MEARDCPLPFVSHLHFSAPPPGGITDIGSSSLVPPFSLPLPSHVLRAAGESPRPPQPCPNSFST
ncbi:hypothetical protein E2C01_079065 [Portunus trituberculatus]|uniref:Uncharacterized protein n=1 Tax=Portunus trituberculatus TaxID=210409 RepID=A0A5B7IUK4_PORTR|nr:hypothetical protein [Portunus trituberculatus]